MSDFVKIPLTRGLETVIDAADAEWVCRQSWHAGGQHGRWYARGHRAGTGNGKVFLHRLIASAPPHLSVDHINGDTLDNRRSNLRACTQAENAKNTRVRPGTSGFRGVFEFPYGGRYRAVITADGRKTALGWFRDPREAALAYDAAARRLHGEFATLNFPGAV